MHMIEEKTKEQFKKQLQLTQTNLTEEELERISNFAINYFSNHLQCVREIDGFLQYAFRWGMLDNPWKTFEDERIGEDQKRSWKNIEELSIKCRQVHTPSNGFSII